MQDEHDAARKVKREAKIIVVLGNPPYNRFAGAPVEEEADLVDRYKGITRDKDRRQVGQSALFTRWGVRKHLLDDLYVRFFRLAERQIGQKAEYGVVSFISNSSYLTGRSHPIMRESILRSFDEVRIDNLNGDKYRTGKRIPAGLPGEGDADQSVFTTEQDARGIQVGACISTFVKRLRKTTSVTATKSMYRDFWGKADAKRRALVESVEMDAWPKKRRDEAARRPEGPRDYEEIGPSEKSAWKLAPIVARGGYEDWPALDEMFPRSFQGVNPNRGIEGSVVEIERVVLEKRMREYFSELPFESFRDRHPIVCEPRAGYDAQVVRDAQKAASSFDPRKIIHYVLFPLDVRWIYYEPIGRLLNRARPEFREHLEENEFLVAVPQPRRVSEARPLFATSLVDLHLHDRGSVCFPRTCRDDSDGGLFEGGGHANLAPSVLAALGARWGFKGGLESPTAERLVSQLFRFSLAILHAPQFEEDHAESLAHDWARIPIPRERAVFDRGVNLGTALSVLLDPLADAESVCKSALGRERASLAVVRRRDAAPIGKNDLAVVCSYFAAAKGDWRPRRPRDDEASRTCWGDETGDLHLNDDVFVANVPERIWRFELGGYPVLKKWLGYREADRRAGRPLTLDEVDRLRGIVHRIASVIALHGELDALAAAAIEDPFTRDELGLGS